MFKPLTISCSGLLLLVVSGLGQASEPLTLAHEGRSEYQVVIAKGAPGPIPAVAEDFVDHFQKITGARLAILTDDAPMTRHEILIGPSRHLDALALYIDGEKLGREGYVIRTYGNQPRGQYLLLFGGPMRGTLNAVYAFLEDHLGCRWYTPTFSVVPAKPDLRIDLIHEERTPPFEGRWIYHADSADAAWAARNRINCISPSLKWVRPPFDHRVVDEIVSDPLLANALVFATARPYRGSEYYVHTLGQNGLLSRGYFESHPEYFGIGGDGKRDARITPCLANPEVLAIVVGAARRWLDQTPGANMISISQSDAISVDDYCHCPNCRASWEKYTYTPALNPSSEFPYARLPGWANPRHIRPAWDPGQYHVGATGLLLDFASRVAENLESDHPGLLVHTFAYYWSTFPPENVKAHPNVVVDFAPLNACHYHPFGCCEYNEQWKGISTAINRWTKTASHVWTWLYDANSGTRPPWPGLNHLGLKFRELAMAGVQGAQFHANDFRDWFWMRPLRSYIFAKILWDPRYDVESGIREFVGAYYGAAAGPMLSYVESTQDPDSYLRMSQVPSLKRKWKVMHQLEGFHSNNWAMPSNQSIRNWDALFDEAERSADQEIPEILERVKMARLNVQITAMLHLEPDDPVHIKAKRDIATTAREAGLTEEHSPAAFALEKAREKWDQKK